MSKNDQLHVAILGSSTKSAVYVSRQLKKSGAKVSIIDWNDLPTRYSRFVDRYEILSDPGKDIAVFMQQLEDCLRRNKVQVLLPIHDGALEICFQHYGQLSAICKVIGVNNAAAHQYAHDKGALLELAASIGIHVPKSWRIEQVADLDKLDGLKYPCIVKAASSAVIRKGRLHNFKVRVAKNAQELADYVREHVATVPLLVQEKLSGFGIGYNVLAKNGRIINIYLHRRINEERGVSSYRETIPPDSYDLTKVVEELIRRIGWNGVAMLEFKVQDGVPHLLEMNGRFWGSIQLGISAGMNFPQQLLAQEVKGEAVTPGQQYRLVRVRNFHDELFVYIEDLLLKGKLWAFTKWWFSTFRVFKRNEYIEDNLFDNPAFVLNLYWYDVKRSVKRKWNRLKFRMRSRPRRIPDLKGEQSLTVAFACFGNICRSPFAAAYAEKTGSHHRFISFGAQRMEDRLPPLNAVAAAADFGVDMDTHPSLFASQTIISKTDMIVVMDVLNYDQMIACGAKPSQLYFLDETDISDPYGTDSANFRYIYSRISTRINLLTGYSLNEPTSSPKNI